MFRSTSPPQGPAFPGVDQLSSAMYGSFMRAMHAHRQLMSRRMLAHGVHPAQMFCLAEVAHNDGVTQRDLAEKLKVARPTLTVMLQKMEKAGLIERRADETDQRFTRIYLTAQGEQMHESVHEIIAQVIDETAGPMSEDDRRELSRLLGLLGDQMCTVLETPEKADR